MPGMLLVLNFDVGLVGVPFEVNTSLHKISKRGCFEFVPHNRHGASIICPRSFQDLSIRGLTAMLGDESIADDDLHLTDLSVGHSVP
ncbi:hypothetical protein L3X38_006197 [Prunus dulcis]|uniref:Uncharacterized protein n=1 Tax=Prunus dulcis TaxID=3755 RepID=A0AAD4ZSC1_PRUDU|nr:hypothetical protein L3X38_006197 [Prunus dulcis]